MINKRSFFLLVILFLFWFNLKSQVNPWICGKSSFFEIINEVSNREKLDFSEADFSAYISVSDNPNFYVVLFSTVKCKDFFGLDCPGADCRAKVLFTKLIIDSEVSEFSTSNYKLFVGYVDRLIFDGGFIIRLSLGFKNCKWEIINIIRM